MATLTQTPGTGRARRSGLRSTAASLLVLAALATLPATTAAAVVPGATYTGTASDGATVKLTISSDGSTVASYEVLGIFGTDKNGASCQSAAVEEPGYWNGAAITSNAFNYNFQPSFTIAGTFSGAQSVAGTFDLNQVASGGSAGCSTGSVNWTATTSSGSAGGGGSTGGSGSGSGSSSGGSNAGSSNGSVHPSVLVRLALRRSKADFTGTIRSSLAACTSRRTVYLFSGRRRLAATRASKSGKFSFVIRPGWHRLRLHATVKALNTTTSLCDAQSTKLIRG